MVEAGDTLGALAFLEDKLYSLPKPKNANDSTLYGWMRARIAFLYFHMYDSKFITADYYRDGYSYLKYLPDTTRIDVLRWTARTLLLQGDTLSALPYLYESWHRALDIGDPIRIAKANTCLAYLDPKEISTSKMRKNYAIEFFGLGVFMISIFFITFSFFIHQHIVVKEHLESLPPPQLPPKPLPLFEGLQSDS